MTEPGAIYYLILYALIIILQFFKTFPLVKDDPQKYNWRNYFYVSLEVVYSSAGVAILLLAQLKNWIGVIMMVYIVLVVIGSFLDPVGVRFRNNTRLALHIIIIAFIVVITIVSYDKLLPKSNHEEEKTKAQVLPAKHFKVALPYIDQTLYKYVGAGRMQGEHLYFSASVDAQSRDEAVLKAKELAIGDTGQSIKVFMPSPKGKQADLQIILQEAISEELVGSPTQGNG
jgi:hypothetical protein